MLELEKLKEQHGSCQEVHQPKKKYKKDSYFSDEEEFCDD